MGTVSAPVKTKVLDSRILLGLGVFLILFSIYILAFMLPDFFASAAGPISMPMAEAAAMASSQNRYVQITDGNWDCDTIHYTRSVSTTNRRHSYISGTQAFLTNGDAPHVMNVTLSGEFDCAGLQVIQPAGYLTLMSDATRQNLTNDARLARFFDKSVFLEMCGYCGQDNAIGGVIGGSAFLLFGVGLVVFARRHPQGLRYVTT